MRYRIAYFLAFGILSTISQAIATVPEKAFDVAAFRSLPQERKLDFVLAVLDARDAELQNVECKVVETHVNVAKAGGARRKMNAYSYTLRRLGPTLWMHLRMLRLGEAGEEVRQESVQNWDGKVARRLGLPPTNGRGNPDGKIESEEYECFGFRDTRPFWDSACGWSGEQSRLRSGCASLVQIPKHKSRYLTKSAKGPPL